MTRLPAHLEVSGLIRAAEAAGGFATLIAKGDREAGVILILTLEKSGNARLWERMPSLDGDRTYKVIRSQEIGKEEEFSDYLARRHVRDADAWIIELDISQPERFIAEFAR